MFFFSTKLMIKFKILFVVLNKTEELEYDIDKNPRIKDHKNGIGQQIDNPIDDTSVLENTKIHYREECIPNFPQPVYSISEISDDTKRMNSLLSSNEFYPTEEQKYIKLSQCRTPPSSEQNYSFGAEAKPYITHRSRRMSMYEPLNLKFSKDSFGVVPGKTVSILKNKTEDQQMHHTRPLSGCTGGY